MLQFKYVFRILGKLGLSKVILLTSIMLFSSLLEGLGLAALLPIFAGLGGEGFGESKTAAYIIDILRDFGLPTDIKSLCAVLLVGLLGRELVMFFTHSYVGFFIADMIFNFRKSMLSSLLAADWKYFSEQKLGSLSLSITSFTEGAAQAINMSVRALAILLRTLTYLCLVMFVAGGFSIFAIIVGVLSLVVLAGFIKAAKKYATKNANLMNELSSHFIDTFGSIKSVKVMAREDSVGGSFSKNIFRLKKTVKKLVLMREGLTLLQHTIELLMIVLTIYIAVTYFGLPIVEMVVIAGLMSQIIINISRTQRHLQKVANSEVYFWRVQEILKEVNSSAENKKGRKKPDLHSGIKFQNVSFSFPGKPILKKVSFHIPANGVTVIFGPSGQGKTTITDLISRLYLPESGKILIDGTPLGQVNLTKWRQQIGYVPQELILLNKSILENVIFGERSISEEEAISALQKAGAWEFVEKLSDGIHTEVGERGMKLSGGQRQRLAIARGLAHNPKLLILDEITSSLDAENEIRICERIKSLGKDKTIIAITHRAAWLNIANKVISLDKGQVVSKKITG